MNTNNPIAHPKHHFQRGHGSFFTTLKCRVENYFVEHRTHPTGNKKLLWKAITQLASCALLYVILVFFTPAPLVAIALCLLLGINVAVVGFNVMHEGGHQTFSRHSWMNTLSALTLNLMGGNAYYWKQKHNVNHHTYTNVEGLDSDIDIKPFMRLHSQQPHYWYHRFQHLYWVVLYSISYLVWVFYEDFVKYTSGKISANSRKTRMPRREHYIFWLSKLAYVALYIAIPIAVAGWIPWLTGFLLVTLMCGLTTAIVFQLAHVVEVTQFHEAATESHYEWPVHQMVSTANFATRSHLLHWLLGGLNFQIEHHLFPRISHVHYPVINRYVKEISAEYKVVYNEYTSLLQAMASHLKLLHRLGRYPTAL